MPATANGNLGRHTEIDSEGYPVIDKHTEVLFKVSGMIWRIM